MTFDTSTTQEIFDRLFNQLLSTLTEERDIRSEAGGINELVEVRDRLHAIRSELAVARQDISALASPVITTIHRTGSGMSVRPGGMIPVGAEGF